MILVIFIYKYATGRFPSATAGIVVRPTVLHTFIMAESP